MLLASPAGVGAERRGRLFLCLILALAAGLRLFRLNFGEYQWDDDGIWSLAVNAVTRHILPAKGINSTLGTGNGPFQVYLMMPLAAITKAPIAGAIAVALLNTLAVYVVYRFGREFFSERLGLIAALLFAVNSWDVEFSRHMAVQGMLIPFQVLFFWNAARWLARGRGLDLVLTFLWLAIATQTYIDGMLHLGSMAIVLALGWRQVRLRPLLIGGALWASLSAYYILAVILPEWRFLTPALNGPTFVDASSLQLAFVQALHTGFQYTAPQMEPVLAPVSGLETAFVAVEVGLYIAGIAYGLQRLLRLVREGKHDRARVAGLLFAWLLFPIAIFVRHQDILTWRHLVLTLPLPAIFSGLLLDRLWPRFGAPLLAALVANSLALAGVFFSVIPSCASNNVYALPYQQTFDLAASVERLARSSHAPRVYVYGQPSLAPILASILDRDRLDALWLDTRQASSLALPAANVPPAVYVTLDPAGETGRALQASAQPSLQQQIPCEGMTFRSFVPQPGALREAIAPMLPISLGLQAADGLKLDRLGGDRRLTPGQPLSVGVAWAWPGAEKDRPAATLFAHLVGPDGRQLAGSDRTLASGSAEAVEWLRLDLPADMAAGRYSLEMGLYDGHDRPLALADGSGKKLGPTFLWGPLVVPPPPASDANLTPAALNFGGQIELTGYRASAGELVLQWQALARPAADYTVFVHALDASGKLVAQADSQPLAGEFPTSTWLPGETVLDRHALALPPGTYTIQAGLYELATLQRLPGGPLEVRLTVP
ncbi:MAG TPA: glycosyltransferase family 39 protein [Chloroflexota bacterium]|nr:glycosyltransferase family 39 protein [Chloroflexota bacterium]